MPDYHFQLQPSGPNAPEHESVQAQDDEEARTLAEMRLLLGAAFDGVTVTRDGMQAFQLVRDRGPEVSPSQKTSQGD